MRGKGKGNIFGRNFFWGEYGGQFEKKSLKTIGKNLGGKVVN